MGRGMFSVMDHVSRQFLLCMFVVRIAVGALLMILLKKRRIDQQWCAVVIESLGGHIGVVCDVPGRHGVRAVRCCDEQRRWHEQ